MNTCIVSKASINFWLVLDGGRSDKELYSSMKNIFNLDDSDGFDYYDVSVDRKRRITKARREMAAGITMLWAGMRYDGKTDIHPELYEIAIAKRASVAINETAYVLWTQRFERN